jgi:hypothetical protein
MISAVITQLRDERRLCATLACLAPAAIDGLVREAIVVAVDTDAGTLAAAEEAGARSIPAASEGEGLAAACAAARGPWLLILTCGARLQSGWESAARRHIERHADSAGWFTLALDDDGAGARFAELVAGLRAGWLGRPDARQGLLISKRMHETVAMTAKDHAGFVRKLGRGGMRSLGVKALI